jgi:hypothetical protein
MVGTLFSIFTSDAIDLIDVQPQILVDALFSLQRILARLPLHLQLSQWEDSETNEMPRNWR